LAYLSFALYLMSLYLTGSAETGYPELSMGNVPLKKRTLF